MTLRNHNDEGAPVRFQVNRDVFSEAVSFVVKLLPQRNPQPILAGVLIEAGDDGLTLSAFDYEASARTTIEAAVDEPGTILVHGRLLSDIASRLPNAPIEISVEDDGGIAVRCGSARFTLAAMPVEEYPSIPEVSGTSGLVPAEDFSTAIAQVGFAASRDDVTPVLTGVQLAVSENTLSLVATDRYRVSLRDVPWDGESAEQSALVPARTLQEVGKTFGHAGTIQISFSGAGDREIIAFTAGNKTVTSLLIKGNFPPVRRLFPEQTDHHAVVNTADLTEAVRRVAPGAGPLGSAAVHVRHRLRDHGRVRWRAGSRLRVGRCAPERRGRHSRAQPAVPARGARRGQERVRAGHVHLVRQREQAQSRAHHQPDLGGQGGTGLVQVPAAAEPAAALTPFGVVERGRRSRSPRALERARRSRFHSGPLSEDGEADRDETRFPADDPVSSRSDSVGARSTTSSRRTRSNTPSPARRRSPRVRLHG